MYVADTWNHRIQKLDADGNLVTAWGLFGQYGTDDTVGQGAFYGPRGIAVGTDGRVYVADTGNKRVQVFDPAGRFVSQWGGGGVLEGYLDEPVGIAVARESVYVADTWNRRVQVFDTNGTYLRQWPIAGWDIGLPDEKPYLAADTNGYIYVTDPGHYRVLVFDQIGNYLLSFGQYGFDEQSFALPMGIAVANDGSVYVVDSQAARILVFDPLNLFDPAEAQ
jgi:DNA-binding beta-propeller fold protein YncE